MATTTNYSWSTPDDTALVKDGAAAIRTLGSSIDTSVKSLNPGTTAGDLDYYTTSTAKARLALGTANQQLRVNSGATAPEWFTPAAAGGMTLINTGGTTLTGASVTIGSIPGTYKNLQLVVQNFLPATDGASIRVRFNADSNNRYNFNTPTQDSNLPLNENHMVLSSDQDNATSQSLIVMDISDYANAATWKTAISDSWTNNATTSTNFNYKRHYGIYNQTGAITSIVLLPSAGNFTSGTAYLYGVS
jgi:hypothetical protein